MPKPGELWKLKGTMAADDVRLRTGAQLREVDFIDLRGEIVLVAGPRDGAWYPTIALSLGGAEILVRHEAFDVTM